MKTNYLMLSFLFYFFNLITIISANGDLPHSVVFPEWTYWAEIIEHSILVIIPLIAVFLLIKPYKTKQNARTGIKWAIAGLIILVVSQALTNLHHFLFYPFGIWNAIIHHGLLVVAVILMIYGFFRVIRQ